LPNGRVLDESSEMSKKFYYLFLIINQIQHHYLAYRFGIYSLKEFRQFSLPTLSLIAREAETIEYLVSERGYTEEFGREILALLKQATPPVPPSIQEEKVESQVPRAAVEHAA
jgi:hypothetical protein